MKTNNNLTTIILIACVVIAVFSSFRTQNNQSFDKITVQEFEMVDAQGHRRASIKVEPEGDVVLRLMDKTGTIRVKLSANEQGSGFVLLNGKTEPGLHVLAKEEGSTLVITGSDGKKKTY